MKIQVRKLSRSFGSHLLFDCAHLESGPTGLIALMGANGSGKTTFFKILSTLILPSQGDIFVDDCSIVKHPQKVRSLLASTFGYEGGFLKRLTGKENLLLFLNLLGRKKRDTPLSKINDILSLNEVLATSFGQCSSGMKQKLHLARVFLQDPKILIFDEPFKSLDIESSHHLMDHLIDLSKNKLVFFSTHSFKEAQKAQQIWQIKNNQLSAI